MKKVIFVLVLIVHYIGYSQTNQIFIPAACIEYDINSNKLFAAIIPGGNYSNSLLQMNPYSGEVEKVLPLNDSPFLMKFTSDKKHLYISYSSNTQIDKINLFSFQIIETINTGEFDILDFAVSPIDDNILFVIKEDDNQVFKEPLFMIKDGVIQPRQIIDGSLNISSLVVSSDGSKLYVHNGISSGHSGHIMEVVDDGISYDGIIWESMLSTSSHIKIHDDLVYGPCNYIIDAFSDSIPKPIAYLPLYDYSQWRALSAFNYSETYGYYLFGHPVPTAYHFGYISFYHGQYYNYLGSLEIVADFKSIRDVEMVDENTFILLTSGEFSYKKRSIIIHQISNDGSSPDNSSSENKSNILLKSLKPIKFRSDNYNKSNIDIQN